jgi:hypothetical protein
MGNTVCCLGTSCRCFRIDHEELLYVFSHAIGYKLMGQILMIPYAFYDHKRLS